MTLFMYRTCFSLANYEGLSYPQLFIALKENFSNFSLKPLSPNHLLQQDPVGSIGILWSNRSKDYICTIQEILCT